MQRIERGHRLLENHRHFDAAQAGHLAFLQIADVLAQEIHTVGGAPRGFWQQAQNPQTEANKMKITSQLSAILNKDDVEVFSTDELPAERRRIMVNGREILSSNNGFLSNYQDAFLVTKYFKEKKRKFL